MDGTCRHGLGLRDGGGSACCAHRAQQAEPPRVSHDRSAWPQRRTPSACDLTASLASHSLPPQAAGRMPCVAEGAGAGIRTAERQRGRGGRCDTELWKGYGVVAVCRRGVCVWWCMSWEPAVWRWVARRFAYTTLPLTVAPCPASSASETAPATASVTSLLPPRGWSMRCCRMTSSCAASSRNGL